MMIKQNLFRAFCALVLLGCMTATGFAAEAEKSAPKDTPVAPVSAPAAAQAQANPQDAASVAASFLQAIRERAKDKAYAMMTPERQEKYGGSPRIFMNTVRITQHAVYDHDRHAVISTGETADIRGAQVVEKVQLTSREGDASIMLIRLVRPAGSGSWRIDGLTLLAGTDERSL